MSWLVCWPKYDTPPKHDATRVFVPESTLVMEALETAGKTYLTVEVDNKLPPGRRAAGLLDALSGAAGKLDGLVYVGHGLSRSLPSLGLGMDRLPSFVRLLVRASMTGALVVCYYACSTADGPKKGVATDAPGMDGGFADRTRDLLCEGGVTGCRVWAHTTSGRVAMNPDLAVFEGMGSPVGGVGGRLLVPRSSPLRVRWKRVMSDPSRRPSLRHRLPFMTPEQVVRELSAVSRQPNPS